MDAGTNHVRIVTLRLEEIFAVINAANVFRKKNHKGMRGIELQEIDELRKEFEDAYGVAELADCFPKLASKLDVIEKKLERIDKLERYCKNWEDKWTFYSPATSAQDFEKMRKAIGLD